MKAIVAVTDKRYDIGMSSRSKEVKSIDEAITWARSHSNLAYRWLTVQDNGISKNILI